MTLDQFCCLWTSFAFSTITYTHTHTQKIPKKEKKKREIETLGGWGEITGTILLRQDSTTVMTACITIVGSFCALKTNVYINQNNQQKTAEN